MIATGVRTGILGTFGVLSAMSVIMAAPALAAPSRDSDRDGMPDWWETKYSMNAFRANAQGDVDHDGLPNLREFQLRADPRSQDSDRDGMDDGDEVKDGLRSTNVLLRDTNANGVLDGDEDSDDDGIDNEDENDFGFRATDADSDDDGVEDGLEDADHNGIAIEDEDDDSDDACVTANVDDDHDEDDD